VLPERYPIAQIASQLVAPDARSPTGAGAGQGSPDPFHAAEGWSMRLNRRSGAGLYGGAACGYHGS